MKKRTPHLIALAAAFFALSAGFLVNHNLKRHYRPGDFVPEENAYYAEKITDPTGLIKAHKFLAPSDPEYSTQKGWSMNNVGNIESVWSCYTGEGTTVAIIDDGFDVNHPEYRRSDGSSAILSTSRYYYSNSSGTDAYYRSYSQYPNCLDEDWDTDYDEWATHGTNTSTTAAAPINGVGGVGIAPGANILALKIDMSFVAIKKSIEYAITQNVDVINMSVGAYADYNFEDGFGEIQNPAEDEDGNKYSASYYSGTATYLNYVCKQAYDAGIIVVASAGNEATTHKSYPACNTNVIGVGALYKNSNTTLAPFTNYVDTTQDGEINVDILAPGYVYTAHQEGTQSSIEHTYNDTAGTSFSSPIVAGAACLWRQKNPSGTPAQFLTKLQSSASNIGYYKNKNIPRSKYKGYSTDVGPSNITQGQLNVYDLMDMDTPFVELEASSYNITVSQNKQIGFERYNGTLTYQSSNTNIATVSNTGLITGVGAGTTTITVTATKNGNTDSASLTVYVASAVPSTSLTFSPNSVTLTVGETYESEPTIVLTPSNASRVFAFASNDESVATVNYETGLVTAVGAGAAKIEAITEYGSGNGFLDVTVEASSTPSEGTISFNNSGSSGSMAVSSTSASGTDTLSNTWTVTTTGTNSFTANAEYYQIGSSKSPATTINFSMTLSSSVTFSAVTARLGGFSGTTADVAIKVGETTVGTGTVPASSDVSVTNSSTASGTTLTVTLSSIQKGIKAYYISYSYTGSGGSSTPTPTVSSVTVSPSSLSLDLNGNTTENLSATVYGTNSPSQAVTWTSSDSSKVEVSSSGVVTAKAVTSSNVTITATSTVDNTKSGTCSVSVVDTTPKTLSYISISGQTASLEVDSAFSFGGTVTAHYSNNTTADVTSSATFTGYNMAVAGVYSVTVSYTEGTTKTTEYTLTVYASGSGGGGGSSSGTYTIGWGTASGTAGTYTNYTSISGSVTDLLSFQSYKNSASSNPAYNETNSELRLYYNSNANGGYIYITPAEGVTFTGFVMKTSTSPTVKYAVDGNSLTQVSCSNNTYTVSGISAESSLRIQNCNTSNTQLRIKTIAITYEVASVAEKVVMSLSASYSGGDLYVGDSLDTTKVSVTANYTDSSTYPSSVLPASDYSLSDFSSSTAGTKTITVTYTGSLATLTPTVTTTFSVTVITDNLTGVVATNSRTYHPGETIIKSHITVTLSYQSGRNVTTSDFSFANDGYQFTYLDAPSGGTNGTKQFSITYNEQAYNFTVNVNRNSYQSVSGSSTTLSSSAFNSSDLSKNSGTASSTSVTIGGVGFTVTTNAYVYSTNSTYYLSFGKGIGSIQNTSAFATDLTSVSVTQKSGARQDGVLSISKDGTNWISYSASEIEKGGYKYFKYEYTTAKSGSNASAYSNLQTISFSTAGADTPINVANYIMYEDTNNQCTTKFDLAIDKLNTMSSDNKTTFWTSNDYVIATARERIQAWARHEGKMLNLSNNNFVVTQNTGLIFLMNNSESNQELLVICVFALVSLASIGGLLIIKKRKSI